MVHFHIYFPKRDQLLSKVLLPANQWSASAQIQSVIGWKLYFEQKLVPFREKKNIINTYITEH